MQLEIGLVISQILAFLALLWIMKKFAWSLLLIVPLSSAHAQLGPLHLDAIQTLVSGKVLRTPENQQGISITFNFESDGTGSVTRKNSRLGRAGATGGSSFQLKWRITENNELCTQTGGEPEICSNVYKVADGYLRKQGDKVVGKFLSP